MSKQSSLMEAAKNAVKDIALNLFKMPAQARKHDRYLRDHGYCNWWLEARG